MEYKFISKRSLCIWISVYASPTFCELQVEVCGTLTMENVHVQSIQYIYRRYLRIYYLHANRA